MLRENELRIGNYIKTDDDIICIVSRIETKEYTHWNSGDCFSITALELNTKDDYLNVRNDNWQPIKLTQEILFKCGFVAKNEYDYFCLNGIKISSTIMRCDTKERSCFYLYLGDENEILNNRIDYVHQLQNLYFALTNEELEIKL